MKKIFIISALALLSLFSFSAFTADDDPITALLKKMEEYTKKFPQEKVHLHLDKPYYAIGDDIWFKAYVIDSRTATPTTISNILYVELINEKDSVKKQLKLPMQAGITWGDFMLTDSLSEGNYRIRAYTQWMRNAGPNFFFDQTIKIGNSWANKVFTKTNNQLSVINNTEKVKSTIQFADKNGKAYANCEVNYEVQLSNRNIAKGKALTNAQGEIIVDFTNTQPDLYKSGKIIATITLPSSQKVIKIIPIKTTSTEVDVQFFPEGGNLVNGLPSKIAIKAINANGLGENVTGTILDNDGVEIVNFETTYLGMGNVFINPILGKTYTAKIKLANNIEKIVALPTAQNNGYLLGINNTDSAKIGVKILLSPDLINKGDLHLVAQQNGVVYAVTKIPTVKQIINTAVLKQEFPSGIVQFTLFTAAGLPVSERLVFVNNNSNLINISPQNLKEKYTVRGAVDLSFMATNLAKPTQGSFSVSVTDTTAVTPDLENETNILTSLLLTSDLTGYIEKPNHYFLTNDAKTKAELDNLLLTQGWRRVTWKNIIENKTPNNTFTAEKYMQISGTITNGGKPVIKGKVSLFSSSGGFFMVDTLTDANGRFNFDKLQFNDSAKFIVQARTIKDKKNVQIDLDLIPKQLVTLNKNTGDIEVNVNQTLMAYLNESKNYFDELSRRGLLNHTITLDEVRIVEKKNPAQNSANLNGAGNADAIITGKELENAFSISQYLQGRVAGLIIQNGVPFLNRSMGFGGLTPMQIILDGVPVEREFLDNIIPMDVESIEVLKSIGNTAIYGANGGSGVLVITTKRGQSNSSYNKYAPGILTYMPKGYAIIRQFFSPKYDVNVPTLPDLRTTVYWNPHIVSNADGVAKFNYYNTDKPGNYRVVIEGIDAFGNLARKVFTYQVK